MATDINTIITRLEQAESTSYIFYPGIIEEGPQLDPDEYPHAKNPYEQSIWFKVYE